MAALLPLIAIVVAFQTGALWGLGWRSGQYAQALLAAVICTFLGAAVIRERQPGSPWRSFGLGMVFAGVTGIVMIAIILTLLAYAFSHWTLVF